MKNNFERFQSIMETFFEYNGVENCIIPISLHDASQNDADKNNKPEYIPLFTFFDLLINNILFYC